MIRAAILWTALGGAAMACDGPGTAMVPAASAADSAPEVRLAYGDIPLSVPFAMTVTICAPAPGATIAIDAIMPAHMHGMNYSPQITDIGEGRFEVQNMVFHMPGLWEIQLELRLDDRDDQPLSYFQEVSLP